MSEAILRVENLRTQFFSKQGVVKAVNGVTFQLKKGSILGVVGESGAGKSVTALSILRLVPFPGRIVQGSIHLNDIDLMALSDEEMRKIRGKEISIVFQDPMAALNPVMSIGTQVEEILLTHSAMSKRAAQEVSIDLLRQMGLPNPRHVLNQYPFQLSGGMAQRIMLAIALAMNPKILIADEPTSNLDVTLQAEILLRLKRLKEEQGSSIILITHNMGVIAQMADEVAVMYAGAIVEYASTRNLFQRPSHPYTWALFQTLPRLDGDPNRQLKPLRGTPPSLIDLPDQCPFLPRCPKAINTCRLDPQPALVEIEPNHYVACYNVVKYQ
ncbi:MAG: ABC transporter ATP-binding protein [Chloroflexi bacterium]|nr:ABC transporter ATP-binding protein [Chloroflexota bacterium]